MLRSTAAAVTLSLSLLAACGADAAPALLVSADGAYRVVFVGAGAWRAADGEQQLQAALAQSPLLDAAFAHSEPMAHGAALAARAAGRGTIAIVGVGADADAGRRDVADGLLAATIDHPTGAAEALDLALLASQGIELPAAIALGTRVVTRDPAVGPIVPSAGDVVLSMLRASHRSRLDASTNAARTAIGVALGDATAPRTVAMRAAMQTWAEQHPAVDLDLQTAASGTAQVALLAAFTARRCAAIVVAPLDAATLAPAGRAALAAGIRVVAVDGRLGNGECTCWVGADDLAIGRAAGAAIRALLPAGGALAAIRGPDASAAARDRHQGFVEELGLAAPPR